MSEFDIRRFINESTEGLIPEGEDPFVVPDALLGIVPRLAEEASKKSSDVDEKDSLEVVKNLMKTGAIGVAVNSMEYPARGLEEDISLRQYRVPERGSSLVVLINPTIVYELGSGDDHDLAVGRIKNVMLDAYKALGELLQKNEFVPNFEV